jgi:hypothetical protein
MVGKIACKASLRRQKARRFVAFGGDASLPGTHPAQS